MRGRAVSRGIATGNIVHLAGNRRQFFREAIDKAQINAELKRFRRALAEARKQIKALLHKKHSTRADSRREILETQILMLADPGFLAQVEKVVTNDRVRFEWAVARFGDEARNRLEKYSEQGFSERAIDIQDICDRVLRSAETESAVLTFPQNTIIVARELAPSTLIEISKSNIAGIVTERGGWTSHTFILARELGIAAVTGIRNPTRVLSEDATALIDGFSGRVVSRPSRGTLKRYAKPALKRTHKASKTSGARTSELKTLDGRRIELFVNLDRVENLPKARRHKPSGVGLFRSELLLENRRRFPSEEEQLRHFSKLLKSANGAPVNIRTFDLDAASNLNAVFDVDEKNPALGLRAIRLSLHDEKLFRVQLSALLRASKFGDLGIVLPMISDLEQVRKVKRLLKSEMRKLKRKRVAFEKPRIGAMIEVPASALLCKALCNEVDFLSLGTNDLIQYLLAVDRDNESVAGYFRTLHPAVLSIVKKVLETAAEQKRPVMICGEMAGSPFYAPILVGLGATQLSMNASSLPKIRDAISNIAFDEAREIASQLVAATTADEGEKLLQAFFRTKWRHIVGFELST